MYLINLEDGKRMAAIHVFLGILHTTLLFWRAGHMRVFRIYREILLMNIVFGVKGIVA
jgi:hypothetical protein